MLGGVEVGGGHVLGSNPVLWTAVREGRHMVCVISEIDWEPRLAIT